MTNHQYPSAEIAIVVVGLDHVQLAMPPGREDEARRFYGAILGLREIAKPAPLAARGGCWFEGQGTQIHLGIEEEFVPARKAHPALRVTDLDVCQQVLAAAGIQNVPDTTLPHVRRFYTADPFGNRIELIQAGDTFTQPVNEQAQQALPDDPAAAGM